MRCGRDGIAEFKLLGWPKMKPSYGAFIFWHIVNFPEGMDKEDTIHSFRQVFELWQEAMDDVEPKGRVIQYKTTSVYDRSHIKLLFVNPGLKTELIDCDDGVTRNFQIPVKLDGKGGTLAYVARGSQTIFFDQGENWIKMGVDSTGSISLFNVALHELGHIHDIGHSMYNGAVMAPYYSIVNNSFTQDDNDAISASWSLIKKNIAEGKL